MMSVTKKSLFCTAFVTLSSGAYACTLPKSYYKNVSCTAQAGVFLAVKDDGSPAALLNKSGTKTLDLFAYQAALGTAFSDGLLPVQKNGKVGYINQNGKVVIGFHYDVLGGKQWARAASDGRIIVKKNGAWGVIDTAGRTVVDFDRKINQISDFKQGVATIIKSGRSYAIDKQGAAVAIGSSTPAATLTIAQTSSNIISTPSQTVNTASAAPVATTVTTATTTPSVQNGGYTVIGSYQPTTNTPLREAIPSRPHIVRSVQSVNTQSAPSTQSTLSPTATQPVTRTVVQTHNRPTVTRTVRSATTTTANAVSVQNITPSVPTTPTLSTTITAVPVTTAPVTATPMTTVSTARTAAPTPMVRPSGTQPNAVTFRAHSQNGKWGFIDTKGVPMIQYVFDDVRDYQEGLAAVRMGDSWGFINPAGDLVIDFRYKNNNINIRATQPATPSEPLKFQNGKAWIGNLADGTKMCINTQGVNAACQ